MTHAYHAPAHPRMRYPGFVEPKPPRPDAPAFPRVDTPLVRPETREELIRGRLVHAAPALLPHARRQFQVVLDPGGTIEDRMLATPLPVRALLDRAAANRAVVQALKVKQDPAILEIEQAGVDQGIVTLCTALDIPLDGERRAHLRALDTAGLEALLTTIGVQHRWP